jgi:hypothetical protein
MSDKNTFPDNFLRGISDESCITPGETCLSGGAFEFDPNAEREDDLLESSICWEDDDTVVELMLKQKKEGLKEKVQFKVGVGVLSCDCINIINNSPGLKNILKYERKKLHDNPYHGNLLINNKTHKIKRRNLSGMLGSYVTRIEFQK